MHNSILLFLLAVPVGLWAQNDLPPVVQRGLVELRNGHCQDAMDLWTSTWPEPQKSQMAGSCPGLAQYAGAVHGYDVIRVVDVTPHMRRVYAMLQCEAEPVFLLVVVYQPGDADWKVGVVNWNTDPDKVIPASILPPQRP